MKRNKNVKYFYSEIEDEAIVNEINADFKRRQEERKIYELTWEVNMNFYMGNQFSYISDSGEVKDCEKRYYWENREVFNHIAPVIETRLAKLNKVKPTLSVRPSSNSDNDIYSAKLAKLILQNCADKNNLESLVSMATAWSEITGTSFYKISWDDTIGNIAGQIDGNSIKNGDVVISVCSPFEIYPDSNGAIDVNDCSSIIEARAYPVNVVNSTWNTNFYGDDVDIFELSNISFLSGMSGRSNITKVAHSKKHDHVLLIEKYEKPTKANPNGRFTIICKNKLLYDGALPYKIGKDETRAYPFIKQVSTKQLASFWGTSIIERCIPIQRAYNAIKNRKHEFIERLTSGVLSVEDGSVDVDNLESEGLAPGKILIYRNGSTPPKFLDSGTIPEELEDEEDKLLTEINTLSCVSDVTTNSSIPSGINSGSALTLLIEQDESRLSLTAEFIRSSIKKIGEFILRLYKQYANLPRLEKLADGNGKLEIYYWTGSDLTSDDVILDTSNELQENNSSKKELALKLLDKGLLNDESGTISLSNKTKLFNMLGFENWEISETLEDMHKNRANRENYKITPLSDPLEVDDHKIHIIEHTKFLISEKLPEKETEFKQALIEHIKLHKALLKGE